MVDSVLHQNWALTFRHSYLAFPIASVLMWRFIFLTIVLGHSVCGGAADFWERPDLRLASQTLSVMAMSGNREFIFLGMTER